MVTECCSESRMRFRTSRGVSKWSRRKDRYIGRLYSEFGKVPSDSGIFRSTGELREFAGEYMGLIGPYGNRGERPKGRRRAAPLWSELDKGCSPFFLPPLPLFPPFSYSNKDGGSPTPGGSRTPLGAPLLGRPPPPPFLLYIRGQGGTSRRITS